MRTLGAILLLISGICLIGYNIYSFYTAIITAQSIGFGVIDELQRNNLILMIYSGVCVLAGVGGILAAIRRRSNFIVSFFGFIIFALILIYLISAWISGTIGNTQTIINLCIGFALPLAYLAGSFLVKF